MELKHAVGARLKALTDTGTGAAIIATLNVIDKDGDVTLPGAFGQQEVKLIPAHDWGHIPIGKAMIKEDGDVAIADFRLNMSLDAAKAWHSALKFDLDNGRPLQEWSYGFETVEAEFGNHNGQEVRFLKRVNVHEISPVILGAGEGTRTLTMKHRGEKFHDQLERVRADAREVLKRAKDIQARRAEDGRNLSQERMEQLKELQSDMLALGRDIGALIADGSLTLEEMQRLEENFIATQSAVRSGLAGRYDFV